MQRLFTRTDRFTPTGLIQGQGQKWVGLNWKINTKLEKKTTETSLKQAYNYVI